MNTIPTKRVPLYERLPEIHRLRDLEVEPPMQLEALLKPVEEAFGDIHANIESLYHDLFIDTCDDWVIPYIGDLLGVSALKGEPTTLRRDVADTIALRRRKGTLAVIERLAANLTGWGAHCVELREKLAWAQHLNHQRPDDGGEPPYRDSQKLRNGVIRRGGTLPIRSPATLALLGTAFDPAARLPDFRAPTGDTVQPNVPNLAIYLWRLRSYQLRLIKPVFQGIRAIASPQPGEAKQIVCFDLHQLSTPSPPPVPQPPDNLLSRDRPVRLFNASHYDVHLDPPVLTSADHVAAPILTQRLTKAEPDSAPEAYVLITDDLAKMKSNDFGLQLLVPSPNTFSTDRVRGECLCRWEAGLKLRPQVNEVIIDPEIGRLLFGVGSVAEANALRDTLLASYHYGSPGDIGAHPISRDAPPAQWPPGDTAVPVVLRKVTLPPTLQAQCTGFDIAGPPIVIEIPDDGVHVLDLDPVKLGRWVIIRASSGHRPIVLLKQSLSFEPQLGVIANDVGVKLEGLFIARHSSMTNDKPLIARAEIGRLEIIGCTLDPGGHRQRYWDPKKQRAAAFGPAIKLPAVADKDTTPAVIIQRSITGGIAIADTRFTLELQGCIIDAGTDDVTPGYALSGSTDTADKAWACKTTITNVTFLGRVRAFELRGRGGIFWQRLEVLHNQSGCIKFSCFSGLADRLPQNHACVFATDIPLHFTSIAFGDPGYAQLSRSTHRFIRERGPGDNEMGAWNMLQEAHRWANLHIRLREFMPVGIRPITIPLT